MTLQSATEVFLIGLLCTSNFVTLHILTKHGVIFLLLQYHKQPASYSCQIFKCKDSKLFQKGIEKPSAHLCYEEKYELLTDHFKASFTGFGGKLTPVKQFITVTLKCLECLGHDL